MVDELLVLDRDADTLLYSPKVSASWINNIIGAERHEKLALNNLSLNDPIINFRMDSNNEFNLKFIIDYFKNSGDSTRVNRPFEMTNASIENGNLNLGNGLVKRLFGEKAVDEINLDSVQLNLSYLFVEKDSIDFDLAQFAFNNNKGLNLKQTELQGDYTSTHIDVEHCLLTLGSSTVHLSAHLNRPSAEVSWLQLDAVTADLFAEEIDIKPSEYYQFHTGLLKWNEIFQFKGKVKLASNKLKFRELNFSYGSEISLAGKCDFNGLTEMDETYISANLKHLETNFESVEKIVDRLTKKTVVFPSQLLDAGDIQFKGSLTGFVSNFVAYGNMTTSYGDLKTDLLVKSNGNLVSYKGELSTYEFNLGAFTKQKGLETLTANFKIDASTNKFKQLSLDIDGLVESIVYKDHSYDSISINGAFENKRFSGKVNANNKYLIFDFNGDLDFNTQTFDFDLDLKRLMATALNLWGTDMKQNLSGNIKANYHRTESSEWIGDLTINDFEWNNSAHRNKLGTIAISSSANKGIREIAVSSQRINGNVVGVYEFKNVKAGFQSIASKLMPNLFDTPKVIDNGHFLTFNFKMSGLSTIVPIVLPQVNEIHEIDILWEYNDKNKVNEIKITSPRIEYANQGFDSLEFDYQQKDSIAKVYFHAEKWNCADLFVQDNIHLYSTLKNNQIFTAIDWSNLIHTDTAQINLITNVHSKDSLTVAMLPSSFPFADQHWDFIDTAQLELSQTGIEIHHLNGESNDQKISLDGKLSKQSSDFLNLNLEHFKLRNFEKFTSLGRYNLYGELNAQAHVGVEEGGPAIDAVVTIDSFKIDDKNMGDLVATSVWDAVKKSMKIDLNLEYENKQNMMVDAVYNLRNEDTVFYAGGKFDELPLLVLEPFIYTIMKDVDGTLDGDFSLLKSASDLDIDGKLVLKDARVNYKYLNVPYAIPNGEIDLTDNGLKFSNLKVLDPDNHIARLDGDLSIDKETGYRYAMDIYFDANDYTGLPVRKKYFNVIRTEKKDNPLYYGVANVGINSKASLVIAKNKPVNLEANITSGPGTILKFPLDDSDNLGVKDYIQFIDSSHVQIDVNDNEQVSKLLGVNLDIDMNVTNDANFHLIFDESTGDVMKGFGRGNINLTMKEDGEFGIFGNYDIDGGDYLFTLEPIINKKFIVESGSKLAFNGDPYKGLADISAVYKLRTSLYELGLSVANEDSNALKKRVPVELILLITDQYMNPNIAFEFRLPQNFEQEESVLNSLDPGEKNMQAFSLLMLNKFMPIDGNSVNANGLITTSSMEMLSNQLSNLLSSVSQDFDLGVIYRPGDEITAQEVEVALSTQIFDDRVSIETNFGVYTDASASDQDANNFMGDVNVEYKVTPDGRVTAKVFNRSNDFYSFDYYQSPYTQGFGLAVTEDFQTVSDLGCRLKRRFASKEKKAELDCEEKHRQKQTEKNKKKVARIERKVERRKNKKKKSVT